MPQMDKWNCAVDYIVTRSCVLAGSALKVTECASLSGALSSEVTWLLPLLLWRPQPWPDEERWTGGNTPQQRHIYCTSSTVTVDIQPYLTIKGTYTNDIEMKKYHFFKGALHSFGEEM